MSLQVQSTTRRVDRLAPCGQDLGTQQACAQAHGVVRRRVQDGIAGLTHSTISTRRGKRVRSCAGTDSATKSNASVSAGNCLYAASPVPSMPGNTSEGGGNQIIRLHVCIGCQICTI